MSGSTPERRAAIRAVARFNTHVRLCAGCEPLDNRLCEEGTYLNDRASKMAGLAIISETRGPIESER
jgi:hypothetical protein